MVETTGIDTAFSALPEVLRKQLLDAFTEIVVNFRESRWEPSELNGGKLCEVVYSIVRGIADSAFPVSASKPQNMVDACHALAKATDAPQSIRITIPRVIVALYEIRNNRGAGHVGSEVNPNHMDAMLVLYTAKWLMAELVRILHSVETVEATRLVDRLVDREIPVVWVVDGARRILRQDLTLRDQMLLVLYHENAPSLDKDLAQWLRHGNIGNFRRDVVRREDAALRVHYDEATRLVHLSPMGIQRVEQVLLTA